jgi:GntR family transcriptional repressor for pyruvate dehydrogenase complex
MVSTLKGKPKKIELFEPIKRSKIADELYKQIVYMVSSGKLKPAEKLPSEREMSSTLGVSRQSIREALNRAETMGLIEVRQGEGSFVLSSVRESLKSPLALLLAEQAERVFEFLEIRKLIEGWCAEKAATEADEEDLGKIEAILNKMKGIQPGDRTWEKMDMEFHFSVVAATHHVIAMHIMEALKVSFDSFFDFRQFLKKIDNKELMWQHHYEVYEAISNRDAPLAKRKIIRHLNFIERKIREGLEEIEA